MRFSLPRSAGTFDIPDAWWTEAGLGSFTCRGPTYPATEDQTTAIVPLDDIDPPRRAPGRDFDHGGFHRDRLIRILYGFTTGDKIPPVTVHELPRGAYRLGVREGFHRFYASAAVGYPSLPVIVLPYFSILEG